LTSEDPEMVDEQGEMHGVMKKALEDEMRTSYIDYSMSVIVSRALPDVRDGLKPVHRRILYAMNEMNLDHRKSYRKSARVVGDVLGKYHPHGDTAVYDALVRMAQDFSLRYPMVDGQGNFGSVDGDRAAAMRYTECRMDKIASELLADIDKGTVDFKDNFDASMKEPTVLPARLPNLLVNGSSGIAVGMATNIPPHNLSEVVDGAIALIDEPDTEIIDLMEHIKGPDFPTGGTLYGMAGVMEAYQTGRGLARIRAKTHFEEMAHDKTRIVVTEIPYQVNKAKLVERIAELVKTKKIDGITDLRDESDRNGMRIVIELRRDVMEDVVLNQLFKHTALQSTFGIINLALVDGKPKYLNIKEMLQHYIDYRKQVVVRRTQYDLEKAQKRAHILEGLLIALDNLDDVISLIRRSKDPKEAHEGLKEKFELSDPQAKAILEMRLQKLTGLERDGIKTEAEELAKLIAELEAILASEERIYGIIKEELIELKEKYGDQRRTEIIAYAEELDIEDLIPEEDVVVTITNTGYIKRLPVDTYHQQKRGGVGLRGMETKEEDYVVDLFVTSTHDYIMFFTTHGKVFWLKAYKVPVGGRHAKGKAIVNLLPRLEEGETIQATIPVREFSDDRFLIFATRNGMIKKTSLKAYCHPRVTGIKAIKLREGDELVEVRKCEPGHEVILATSNGLAARFMEDQVRPSGRDTMGVIGIRLREGDELVSMALVHEDSILLTITENGYGKRSQVANYRKTKRGAHGVITIRTTERNGSVVSVREVESRHELILTSINGMVIRIPASGISVIGRATQGVRIMKLKPEDRVIAIARLVREEKELAEQEHMAEEEKDKKAAKVRGPIVEDVVAHELEEIGEGEEE